MTWLNDDAMRIYVWSSERRLFDILPLCRA